MKKTIIFIIAVCVMLYLTACQTVQSIISEPVVSLQSVELAGINFNGVQLLCKVQVTNPNAVEIPFPEISFDLFLNSNFLLNGTIRNNRRLGARASTVIDVPVSFEYLGAFNAISSLRGRTSANYKTALALKFSLPIIGEKVLRLEHEGSVPLPQAPKLSAPSMNVEKADLSGATVGFSFNIENPNPFELPAPKINFDFLVNRTSVINSTASGGALRPNTTTPVQMRFSVSQADLARVLAASLLTSPSLASQLNISVDFGIPVFSGQSFTLQIPGTLPLR